MSATSSVAVGTTSWTRKEELCSISWSFPLRWVSTHYMFLWMCGEFPSKVGLHSLHVLVDVWGELASHKRSHYPSSQGWAFRSPLLYMFVCLSGLWLGGLPFFPFCYHKASGVLYMHMCFHAYIVDVLYRYVCVCVLRP